MTTKSLKSLDDANEEEIKMMRSIKAGITDVQSGHYHTVEIDETGQWCYYIRISYVQPCTQNCEWGRDGS